MDFIGSLLDFVFHIDVHLATFVQLYGTWVYALLFAIIFVETGLVVMPFLPGDSLLFVVGAMCAHGLMSLPVVLVLLWIAAVLGNQSNYTIGHAIGPRVFGWKQSRWFNKQAFDQAHSFYERYGGITIVAARFMRARARRRDITAAAPGRLRSGLRSAPRALRRRRAA